jgi:[ribosomal protein S18]-alanine N-acetyltransferase
MGTCLPAAFAGRTGAAAVSGPVIRRMAAEDVPTVMQIERASYTMPWSEITFRGLLSRTDAELVVAVVDGVIAGYAVFWMVVDQAELGNVAVDVAYRSRGLGAHLVETAAGRAASRGAREIFLEVRPSNSTARQLYERHDFREVGRRRHYYTLPTEDAIIMRRDLAGLEPDAALMGEAP